jgi:hypothetical protein
MSQEPEDLLEFQLLDDTHPLRVEAARGSGRRLMVSFTSVGTDRDTWPPKEFIKLCSNKGENHVIFITDISRCWMNSKGMDKRLTTLISDYIMDHGITSIAAIGVSMGAFNALVLGKLMPVSPIIAFAPQYSVHPEIIPDEDRWMFFRKQITDWPYPEMDTLPGPRSNIFMFHGDSEDERRHWQRFPREEHAKHYIFPGGDHSFASKLKSAGVLQKIARAAINNKPGRMNKVIARAGGLRREDYQGFADALDYFETRKTKSRPAGI